MKNENFKFVLDSKRAKALKLILDKLGIDQQTFLTQAIDDLILTNLDKLIEEKNKIK